MTLTKTTRKRSSVSKGDVLQKLEEEIAELRRRHGALMGEAKVQKERVWVLTGLLEDVVAGEERVGGSGETPKSYFTVDNPPVYAEEEEEEDGEENSRQLTVEDKEKLVKRAFVISTEIYEKLTNCTSDQLCKGLSIPPPSKMYTEDIALMRQKLVDMEMKTKAAEETSRKTIRKLNKLMRRWHAAALTYNIRPLVEELPELKPPRGALEWNGRVVGKSEVNMVDFVVKPPKLPRGAKVFRKQIIDEIHAKLPQRPPTPDPGEHQSKIAIQGFRLLVSAFCTDAALLLHRISEIAISSPTLPLPTTSPYFIRDKISHALLTESGFRNPFRDEIPMLHDVYHSIISTFEAVRGRR